VPATVKAISGVDVKDLLQKTANKHFGGDSKKAMAAAAGAAGMSAMSVSEKRALAEAAMGTFLSPLRSPLSLPFLFLVICLSLPFLSFSLSLVLPLSLPLSRILNVE